MARKLPTLPTQGPSRGVPRTSGSLSTLTFASFARLFGDSASPAMSGTWPDRSRMRPSLSTMPGFSRPAAPKRTSFIVVPFWAIARAGRRGRNLAHLLRVDNPTGSDGSRRVGWVERSETHRSHAEARWVSQELHPSYGHYGPVGFAHPTDHGSRTASAPALRTPRGRCRRRGGGS